MSISMNRAACGIYHRPVSFLVEGLSVDVPQTLLDRFPNTKLANLAEEHKGSQAHDDDNEPIAIDVELSHFRDMVALMRDKRVTCMRAHPFLTTLDSFGFQYSSDIAVVNDHLNDTPCSAPILHVRKHLDTLEAEYQSRIAAVRNEHTATPKETAKKLYKAHCLTAARFLFLEHLRTKKLEICVPMPPHCKLYTNDDCHALATILTLIYSNADEHEDFAWHGYEIKLTKECFEKDNEYKAYHQECLMMYGLEYTDMNYFDDVDEWEIMVRLTQTSKNG